MTSKLTEREQQILKWLLEGSSYRENARQLDLQEKTVKQYMTRIFLKLKWNNRTQARSRGGEFARFA